LEIVFYPLKGGKGERFGKKALRLKGRMTK
jgi:hypothetical protein